MKQSKYVSLAVWVSITVVAFVSNHLLPDVVEITPSRTLLELVGVIAGILAVCEIFIMFTNWLLVHKGKPIVEGIMIARLYRLIALLVIILSFVYSFGKLTTFGTLFSLFGGMLLGWSLQAPVSGFAAWVLVTLKRPFRIGDRIQFPSLGLIGDVRDIGAMYTVLDQVGGTISSEEAVGRDILMPNAMLFGQVVINYTVRQEAPYFLDEVVVRITYDSDWQKAEEILLNAANDVTKDIIQATGIKPYIRSDIYDYGIYLRLRHPTRSSSRAEIAHEITKRIFNEFQKTRSVDFAIPYIYSFRAGQVRDISEIPQDEEAKNIREIEIDLIHAEPRIWEPEDIQQLMRSISTYGLLQPIVVVKNPKEDFYEILTGQQRLEACKRLGWKTIPSMIRGEK